MGWEDVYLDAVLVPSGLMLLIAYHVRLLYLVHYKPRKTVIGINHIVRRAWVKNIMEDSKGNGVLAVQTIRNTIMGSTLLATAAITIGSFLGTLAAGRSKSSTSGSNALVVGSHSSKLLTVKYVTLMICFLLAFMCHVQAIRYASHVSFLITTPCRRREEAATGSPIVTQEYVSRLLKRSTDFFSMGMRAYYFSFTLLFWLFGPIPQFLCSLVMLLLLGIVDNAKDDEIHIPFHLHEAEEAAAAAGAGSAGAAVAAVAAAPSRRICQSPEHERPPV